MAKSHEMLLDVKLDLKDARSDSCLKNWVNWMKCLVKIEAIECFPCYLKIAFYHEDDVPREYPISIIRLNIPGVRVGSAASRTKSFTYGVFWKNNRKRCRLFLAFQDKQSCSMHMKWLKQSIDSLEQYRKEILENHRISRTIINAITTGDDDDSLVLDTSKNSLNDTQTERDMNDILGPLPDIPVSCGGDNSRLSLRRSSGCSGIYEEILDPTDVNVKKEQESRGSIVSAIYVDMSAALQLKENVEQPPPLPPRRPTNSHVYTPINTQAETSVKTRKSSWNLKNVFGRTKEASKNGKSIEVSKSQTTASISKLCSNDYESNLLANGKNSFSTPDLTILIEPNKLATPVKCDGEEVDLDVMDIERSNSLNCSSNQFTCRPAPLNISDNILWSHNLSLTLSSTVNSSAINLVGANVNGRDSYLGRDVSGYCKMAPILNKGDKNKIVRTSTTHFEEQLKKSNQGLDSSSVYCAMAPILPKTDLSTISKLTIESPVSIAMKNITFERTFDFDDDRPSRLDYSLKSFENSNHASLSDITTSSGVSSYDGNAAIMSTTPETPNRQEHDDAISLTYTESPPQTSEPHHINENPFVFNSTKFDEKIPSYFPNEKSSPMQDTTKYTVNTKNVKQITPKNRRKPSEPVAIPVNKESNTEISVNNLAHFKNAKKQTCKGVLKTPTLNKVQKFKRRGSVTENTTHVEHHPTAIAYKNENENWYHNSNNNNNKNNAHQTYQKPIRNCKYDTLPPSFESKMSVLSHLDPNTKYEPNRHASFEKNSKSIKNKSSPRRIYNKWATLAIRLKTPPSTPTETNHDDRLNCSIDTVMRSNKNYHIPDGSDGSSNGITRSWARFRKIDFSPLKTKINSIWQRSNSDTEAFN